jgi:adenine-specific DNA-methyltransferase
MPTTQQLRQRLLNKLNELFQLDQPDLDFGFYRIMHSKAREVQEFINNDLLHIVSEAFGDRGETDNAELKARIDREIEIAKEYGVPDPENSPKVKEARDAYNAAQNTAGAEAEVYDHLYRFFERYYEDGDFISRRYYTRETSGRAAPFAIPYNGEEVKLHWANADQYYVKSAEYFSNFSFDLRQAKEVQALRNQDNTGFLPGSVDETPRKVHFRIVEATEGEHGNIKSSEANKRFFIIHKHKPVELNESGELVCNFEYRPDSERTGQEGAWREKRNSEAVETILQALERVELRATENDGNETATQENRANQDSIAHEYVRLLKVPAPTAKDKHRPLLAKYINQYTARNTMDYFIHKDLCGFLRRELDFYIKNEVMHLDDIQNADAPAVDSYLTKIKVLRTIAAKLIDFLAQIEDFQKKLWLKKKFVVETNYCMTLDRVPEDLYPDILTNESQIAEWRELFAIDEIEGFSRPLTTEFLQANDKLLLDTRFFDPDFTARLVDSIENFDEQCDGVLVHSENFQALNLLQNRYQEQVKCVYIDPPYNTDASPIAYKNSYRNSSWLSLIENRLTHTKNLCLDEGIICVTIDDFEKKELESALEEVWGKNNILGIVAIRNNPSGRPTPLGFAISHEYAIFVSKLEGTPIKKLPRLDSLDKRYKENDENGKYMWELLRKRGSDSERKDNPKAFFPFYVSRDGSIRVPEMEWDEIQKQWLILENPLNNEIAAYPIDDNGVERRWRWGIDKAKNDKHELKAKQTNSNSYTIYYKYRPPNGVTPTTNWIDSKYSSTEHGTNLLKTFFTNYDPFSFPKSIYAVQDCLLVSGADGQATILDYFAGSGTTAHAIINLNRNDAGKRKYVLVEMGDYFDVVLKPRIAKVVYSESWKDGKL